MIVDLRSDTVTKPTKGMLEAMMSAEVGDDVLGDDPTVLTLQEKIAALLGKESALFLPSGTMANQVAIRTHTEAGDEIIMESTGHTFLYETGALSGLCGVQAFLISGDRGLITAAQIAKAIRPKQTYVPPTKLVVIENTHNHGGGTVYTLQSLQEIHQLCKTHGIPSHLDGARLWNACIATGIAPKTYADCFDSVSVCLSKGLGAPVGSMIAGSKPWIERAKRFRKMFGGGMRQAGILAAAGIYALERNFERLAQDHEHAKYLATSLKKIPHVIVQPDHVQTNILFFGIKNMSAHVLAEHLKKKHIWLFPLKDEEVRAVTHMGITREQMDHVVSVVRELAS